LLANDILFTGVTMTPFTYRFAFSEDDASQVKGSLELDEPLPLLHPLQGSGFYRPGKIALEGWPDLEIVLYHSQATSTFMYLGTAPVDENQLWLVGLTPEEIIQAANQGSGSLTLPGQLCMGSDRSRLIGEAICDIIGSPLIQKTLDPYHQQNLAVFPIAREGLKYQVAEALFDNYHFYCDEIILDAHHVFDSSVPVYNRKVELTLFKDKDLDQQQRENISVAFIADSIASGLVMKEVIAKVAERFDRIQQVEVIAPLATVRGLCRIARSDFTKNIRVRLHVFETLLNALPPDYYYSAHYNIPELHIRPDLQAAYRDWWGQDSEGNSIADTACAGYGWSEVFFSPRRQIKMMNGELQQRHGLTIADIVRRKLKQS
jgi:hypothetical protein